jgi:hypothetical protein
MTSSAAASDPLAQLNDELRARGPEVDDESPWLPLESNPQVFTAFAHSVGCPKGWGWVDVLGLDDVLLDMVPQPCAGVVLLFPCTDGIYSDRAVERSQLLESGPTDAAAGSFHITQVVGFGNACGTIASVHALINGAHAFGGFDTGDGGAPAPLAAYRDAAAALEPEARGHALLKARALKSTSDRSAQHVSAQTECPDRDGPDLDHHFVAFSPLVHQASNKYFVCVCVWGGGGGALLLQCNIQACVARDAARYTNRC